MAEQPWVSNRYLRATLGNFTRTSTIGNDVAGVLIEKGADIPAVLTLANYFTPKNTAYQEKFGQLDTAAGLKKGASFGLKQMIEGMRVKANTWKKAIANVYDEHTEEYLTILPNGIGPLTEGKQASILQAIEGLSGRLAGVAPLAATKADVDDTYTLLNVKNQTQKGKVGERDVVSEELENERIALCKALLYVEGGLMQIYADSPEEIDSYFPLELLRRRPQTEFTGSVNAGDTKFIVKRKLEEGEDVRLQNSGENELVFYCAPTKTTPLQPQMMQQPVAPGADITVDAALMGASATNVYLMVFNNPGNAEGHWTVEI